MYILISVFACVFDAFLLYVYTKEMLRNKRECVSAPLILFCLALVEGAICITSILLSGNTSIYKQLITVFVSFITTFLLTYLYDANFSHRLFISMSYIVYTIVGESVFAMILSYTHPIVFTYHSLLLDSIISIGMEVLVFIFVLVTSLFWNRNRENYSLKYKYLLFITPIITILIKIFIPESAYQNKELYSFFIILFICLIVINIVNYCLLDNVLQLAGMKIKFAQEQNQNQLQQERYEQLSSAYKQTRSIVHDVKEHYFFIDNCIQKQQYIAATDYMKNLVHTLENSYTKVNTGNLVIDTLVSHYMNIAEEHNIRFEFILDVDNTCIPTEEYDLCIILGNLLDNCLQACKQIPEYQERFITIRILTYNKHFLIHTINPIVSSKKLHENKLWDLYHGYGLNNVKKLTEGKYKGTFAVLVKKNYEVVNTIPYFS